MFCWNLYLFELHSRIIWLKVIQQTTVFNFNNSTFNQMTFDNPTQWNSCKLSESVHRKTAVSWSTSLFRFTSNWDFNYIRPNLDQIFSSYLNSLEHFSIFNHFPFHSYHDSKRRQKYSILIVPSNTISKNVFKITFFRSWKSCHINVEYWKFEQKHSLFFGMSKFMIFS